MASTAVRSKVVVLLLFNHLFIVASIVCWVLFCNVVLSVLLSFAIISLTEEERA